MISLSTLGTIFLVTGVVGMVVIFRTCVSKYVDPTAAVLSLALGTSIIGLVMIVKDIAP